MYFNIAVLTKMLTVFFVLVSNLTVKNDYCSIFFVNELLRKLNISKIYSGRLSEFFDDTPIS